MTATAPEVVFPPLARDRRVQGWILSAGVSQAGDVAWYVGLAWSAAQVTTPAGVGLVMGIGALPRALVLLWGGALADRLDARRTMILANLGRILVLAVAAAVVGLAGVSVPLLLTVAAVFGVVDAIYTPAAGTMPRRMVRGDDLVKLAAGTQLANRLAVFVGAPLGGLLVAHGGLAAVMLVNAASFAVIAIALVWIVRPRLPQVSSGGASVRADLRAGFAYLRRDLPARTLVIALSGLNLCVGPVLAVGLVQRTSWAGWGAGSLGLFQACSGLLAAAGAVLAMRWKPSNPARTGLLALIFQAAGCAAIGLVPRAGVFVAMGVIGFTAGLASAQLSAVFQRTVDPGYLGRTSSIVSLSDEALMPVAMTGFGALVSLAGIAAACGLIGAFFAALMLWSAARMRRPPEQGGPGRLDRRKKQPAPAPE
ncbi:major facilitator superfamily MFS_1 [Kribbella flavida DSM 17836]|uniref:Major facilitator superfamily MFS_1 n=1 Tax=Kribbella flavida (strain DSM 17836 / JCM 10339 / NBRC 14399) TaxID=479435 RepID=D2PKS3_KRIFD|nr:MFS transporter [Kribbella flavida]ADB32390.1 major facilitator superfamily MFS_1 [Kribbella flavida DSM 17836]